MPRMSLPRLVTWSLMACTVVFTLHVFTTSQSASGGESFWLQAKSASEPAGGLLGAQRQKVENGTFDSRFVLYNRVPKCGSMSMTTLLYKLGSLNKYRVASPYEDGERQDKGESEELAFVSSFEKEKFPYAYIRHLYFVDFTQHKSKQPMYINIMRDPFERFQSFYYFRRFGNTRGGGSARMDDVRKQETIDECVEKRRAECLNPFWQVVPYFCGNQPGCASRSQWSVDQAKSNIENHYLFVGYIEELEKSLDILEYLAPKFFADATKTYRENPENQRVKTDTRTNNKKLASAETIKFMQTETSLRFEYQLYEFAKERFALMHAGLVAAAAVA